ncbi:Ca-activated chloride channel family protein [Krasilnikovia cinnamomea]|uniref:Ca-activated chloride channel family protein n=1 Tax=Krasilnikovia cinnamomea TaxID=349313 RepID=A0A4Q7ZTM4_9ACTN|nr:VIT domain-containing protein [Krasilnikovia cinnamomea]RZU54587.1 Ca-activated chloride channel family protein [Krasilnikovia cinnamomea]
MTFSVLPLSGAELDRAVRPKIDGGVGILLTERGNLPLDLLDVQAAITGLVAHTVVTTEFVNVHDTALEATYVFPLPDRAAVTGMTMTADGRTIEAELRERAAARQQYDQAVAAGQRASIAEEERPDVFTMRVGNIAPGERVTVRLRLAGPLPYEDGAATFRFPLVVAPRYIPGAPLPGPAVGDGYADDTDAVPDASRITPPVLLPGFPNPLRLSIGIDIDPAGLTLGEVRSSLHTVTGSGGHLEIRPGERADRDFVLRLAYAGATQAAIAVPDADGEQGSYQLTLLPPADAAAGARPKDVVLLLDRSGSMEGWKIVAARRAAARVVDTLTGADRFAVLTFDHQVERVDGLGAGLVEASDRNRFRAVEHLARATARGGTELLAPLDEGLSLLHAADGGRDRVLVLVTDGQVGNEDQILAEVAGLVGATRVHAVGIDRAVNAGFLGRLAALGAGRCELVESEDRLDEAMEHIHRRIGSPVVTDLSISAEGLATTDDTRSPYRLPGLYPGVPLVITGRYTGAATGALTVTGRTRDDGLFTATVPVRRRDEPAVTAQWARARLRDLEDRYAAGEHELEPQIVSTSLRFGVLCRFTAYVAVDARVVAADGAPRRVTQPVELPSGWASPAAGDAVAPMLRLGAAPPVAPAAAPMAPGFAPARGSARAVDAGAGSEANAAAYFDGEADRHFMADAAPPSPPPAMPPPPPSGPARTFAAVPSVMRLPRGHRGGARRQTDALRDILAVEARRLRDAGELPAAERRDLLSDLASRLGVLLAGLSDPAVEPLRALVDRLNSGEDLADRWRAAREVLDAFLAGHGRPARGRRATFWKR